MITIETNQYLPKPTILTSGPNGVGAADIKDPAIPLGVLIGHINLNPEDQIELLWGNNPEPVVYYTHSSDAPEQDIFVTLYVDTQWIKSEQTPVPVSYRYIPFPGGAPQDSDITHIRVKLEAPGGIDIDPATPYENEALRPPRVQPPAVIVDPQGVRVIVTPYEQMSEGDRIRVSWAESTVDHPPLTAAEAGMEVVIPIPPQIIEAVGDSSKLPVRYEVHDVVGNWSKRSPATEVVVSIG
ncbi:hypothetical protein [Pseudomonas gingeri]|uniref:hypothetical protein n=1 Tax=Pseudomonas gingeri TaxID=117681 RepID=UPI00159FE12F|nr:hypothetical protein [Pseudomonas gingeri]NWD07401.1 hypothetical protein [Pseudomonas gingeri]NWE31988.1 hypothetical protein [Pseudomonas gingeri]NWE55815.1 hypothetical protein [Pseudomonas gingeri]NWF01547.1 hypothetical protein [Pseudomonas gingeri]